MPLGLAVGRTGSGPLNPQPPVSAGPSACPRPPGAGASGRTVIGGLDDFRGEKAAAGRAGSERHANMAPDCPPGIGGKYHLAGGLLGENGRTNGVLADGPG